MLQERNTKMELNEINEVLKAYRDNETIQIYNEEAGTWSDIFSYAQWWNFEKHKYRVKPKQPVFLDKNDLLVGKIVIRKLNHEKTMIISQSKKHIYVGNNCYTYKELFEEFTFENGNSCSK